MSLLTRPWSMPPRKQYDAQLGDDVRVRYIEVVFQGGDGDESTNLRLSAHFRDKIEGCGGLRTYVLLSTYCWPASKAVLPICKPTCAVGSFIKPPNAGCMLYPP
jgi:hypothetical protein